MVERHLGVSVIEGVAENSHGLRGCIVSMSQGGARAAMVDLSGRLLPSRKTWVVGY